MFVRAQAEYGHDQVMISAIVREHKAWIQNVIYQSLGNTPECAETAMLIMLLLEGMTTYAAIFGTTNHNFMHEKQHILALIDQLP